MIIIIVCFCKIKGIFWIAEAEQTYIEKLLAWASSCRDRKENIIQIMWDLVCESLTANWEIWLTLFAMSWNNILFQMWPKAV